MKVFTIQFTEDELTELENVVDQHVYAEAIENKGSEGNYWSQSHINVHYQNSMVLCQLPKFTTDTSQD